MIKTFIKENYKFLIALFLFAIIFKLSFLLYIVNGESMYPTLKDHNIGIALRTTWKNIERENIVVIDQNNRYLIKRVIGLPGEEIEYKNNKLYIDGKEYIDKFSYITNDYYIKVGKNEYFCLGDNRTNSTDSREYGCFNKKQIKAISLSKK